MEADVNVRRKQAQSGHTHCNGVFKQETIGKQTENSGRNNEQAMPRTASDKASRLLIYSLNYAPELTGIGKYNAEMAEWLATKDVEVDVICANPYYPEWKVHEGYPKYRYMRETKNGVRITRCPTYVPAHPAVIKRILHLMCFALTSLPALFAKFWRKPDVIFVVQPTLFCLPMALLFGKLCGARTVLHIQDFEIDAMLGLREKSNAKLSLKKRMVLGIESWLMCRFDTVTSISRSMLRRAKEKGVAEEKLGFFPNWSDTDFITPETCGKALREEYGFRPEDKVILYSGNIGAKQGLELILEAAEQFKDQPQMRFLIIGEGAHKSRLEELALERQLPNLEFKPLVPWESVPYLLAMADVHLVIQRKGVADSVLPSKLTNILSAGGHAVVTAEPNTELGMLSDKHPGVIHCVEPEDCDALMRCIMRAIDTSVSEPINRVARDYAERFLARESILTDFFQVAYPRQRVVLATGKQVLN